MAPPARGASVKEEQFDATDANRLRQCATPYRGKTLLTRASISRLD
jgi:hypothetical protein